MAAVGSIVFSYKPNPPPFEGVVKITMDWLCSDGGIVSGTKLPFLAGEILAVKFIPDAGGTIPTDAYDVTLLDDDGVDVLLGLGANLNHDLASTVIPIMNNGTQYYGRVPVLDELELVVGAAGNAKGGKVILFLLSRI